MLDRAAQAGIDRLPALCHPTSIDGAAISTRLVAYVDEITVSAQSVYLGGWAMLPYPASGRSQIHGVLRSPARERVFTTQAIQRPGVAQADQAPCWRLCGFRFVASHLLLRREDFQMGLLIVRDNTAEYTMTERWRRRCGGEPPQRWISNDS